jgi:hypothetical protein
LDPDDIDHNCLKLIIFTFKDFYWHHLICCIIEHFGYTYKCILAHSQAIIRSIFIPSELYPITNYIRDANEGVPPSCTLYTKIQVHIITPTTLFCSCNTTLEIISSLYQSAIASVKVGDQTSGFVVIRVDGEEVSILFPLGSDGIAVVTTIRLSLRFQLNKDSLHIDEEVYDSVSHTIGQLLVCNGDGKHWLLGPWRFRLYGLSESVMAATTILATPLSSPSCTIQTSLNSRV